MPFPLESLEHMYAFFWVLVRISVLLMLLPLFGARGIPFLWKTGLSVLLALILVPTVPRPGVFPQGAGQVILGIISEALMGMILALGVNILMASIQMAGEFMSFQMGFSMARSIDPMTGSQDTALSQFMYLFAILIFFSMDGHHVLIRALADSFHAVPPMGFTLNPALSRFLIHVSAQMFLLGLKLASPILVALFLSNLCLGIVARTVPQVNILMVGFPVNICLGLIFFGLVLCNLSPFLEQLTRMMGEILKTMLRLM